ncbi:endolytic transglycosylase MltG [Bacteroidales bacterium]|nr:endolytic transglycosylase MltG [Bacteroidales bacterium]
MANKTVIKKKRIRIIFIIIAIVVLGALKAFKLYSDIFTPNFSTTACTVFVPTGVSFDSLVRILNVSGGLANEKSFRWVANQKSFKKVKAGKYTFNANATNNDVVNKLRSGRQSPIKVTFNNLRLKEELAGVVAKQLELDSSSLVVLMNDSTFISELGFNKYTIPAMFIPNTYEFYWNTSAQQFLLRMNLEYKRFWKGKREKKLKGFRMTKVDIVTLASIVDEETLYNDELPKVAGLYMNRLNKRIRLGADPTLKFALGDFNIRRILKKDMRIDSPYNTYIHYGLPPGPIAIPSIQAIDAVLNYEKHDYIYMCAKHDFSGYHAFAKSHREHLRNAARYHKVLNERKIYR